ncbi:MAG: hypothetical protein KO206_03230 [Methanomicrobiaceae archaeon]|uniref:Uncharacterized protein n=1 Tax=hydrocarbon metagenome TaxID=938273 RepID=A0A0W8FDR3_9ZZZZ|nr:hypothetical protein [Methanomicrobiaceae archaeon]MDD5420490.1 hypothetical protein [Methanomicrobiaceae archaeon]
MICRTGLLWDSPLLFGRYVEDCGACCEFVTPHMLASPFYRGRFVAVIAPTGFGNPAYSNLLPALRASSQRIRKFVEMGGRMLVFGAGGNRPDSYDWLPFRVTYQHVYRPCSVTFVEDSPYASVLADCEPDAVECDGWFPDHDATTIATCGNGESVMILKEIGEGVVVITSIHEYPSREFVKDFSCADRETLF